MTTHGGMLVEGSPDTTIGGMPASRLLDKHVCPLHGPGPVTQTSFTVFINKMGAARMGDACTCMIPAKAAGGGTAEAPKGSKFEINPTKTFDYKKKEREFEKDGKEPWKEKPVDKEANPKLSVALSKDFYEKSNADQKKGAFEKNVYEVKGTAKAGVEVDLANLRNAKAEAGAQVKAEYSRYRAQGKAGDVTKGSFAEGSAEAKVMTAKASAGAGGKFEVKDGKLQAAYVGAEAGIGGSVVEGKATGKTRAFKIPFTNWGISFGGEVSGALLTAEAKAGAHAGYKDNKWSFGLSAKVGAAIAGLGLGFTVSVEKLPPPAEPPVPPGIPGVAGIDPIALGCMTVLIGGFPPPYIPGPPKKPGKAGKTVRGPGGRNQGDKGEYAAEKAAVRQRTGDLDQIYLEAEIADVELRKGTSEIAALTSGRAVFPPGLKGRERAMQKIASDYGGDASQLLDVSRSSIEFKSMKDLNDALDKIGEKYEIVRVKNRFDVPVEGGYRDVLLNVKMPNGHVTEMQLHLEQILAVKNGEGHKIYEEVRGIKAAAKIANRDLSGAEVARVKELTQKSEALYGAAFAAASKG